jgi:Flp pilus assembly pilin Flp
VTAAGATFRSTEQGRPQSEKSVGHLRTLKARVRALDVGDNRGQGLAEYALILALIAIVSIVALVFLGGQISHILSDVGKSM